MSSSNAVATRVKLGFGVTIGRGRIAVDRAEVALSIDQRIAQGKRLRQANQRVIHREVAVRVVFAHHFSDDAGALTGRLLGARPICCMV